MYRSSARSYAPRIVSEMSQRSPSCGSPRASRDPRASASIATRRPSVLDRPAAAASFANVRSRGSSLAGAITGMSARASWTRCQARSTRHPDQPSLRVDGRVPQAVFAASSVARSRSPVAPVTSCCS
ncbi:hypothetical protein DDP54_12175 [Cellulomonas sp. WB94]|nr:hypothetical protein DDP54_12175 [Cellulomonas sp. WB94]